MNASTITGSCLCGAVAFAFELPTLFAGHCHCTMCQRAHGAGFVTWIGVREDGFRLTAGSDVVIHYRSSGVSVRSGRGMGPVKRISHVEARPHKVLSFCW